MMAGWGSDHTEPRITLWRALKVIAKIWLLSLVRWEAFESFGAEMRLKGIYAHYIERRLKRGIRIEEEEQLLQKKATAIIQARDSSGLGLGDSIGDGEEWFESGYIVKVEQKGFASGLDEI